MRFNDLIIIGSVIILSSDFNFSSNLTASLCLLNHPGFGLDYIKQIFTRELVGIANQVFNFYNGASKSHYTDSYVLITVLLQLFIAFVLFLYPRDVEFDLKTRIGCILVILMGYIGICTAQLLTWSYVGEINLGLSLRYFIPLLALIPIVFGIRKYFDRVDVDHYTITLIIVFMATLILSFAAKYY